MEIGVNEMYGEVMRCTEGRSCGAVRRSKSSYNDDNGDNGWTSRNGRGACIMAPLQSITRPPSVLKCLKMQLMSSAQVLV